MIVQTAGSPRSLTRPHPSGAPSEQSPSGDRYEGPTALDTVKSVLGVTAFAAGPGLAAAQWGLPGAALGVCTSALAMWLMDRDREIMVPFTAVAATVMTVPALLFGWPGALVSTALCAGYGYWTK